MAFDKEYEKALRMKEKMYEALELDEDSGNCFALRKGLEKVECGQMGAEEFRETVLVPLWKFKVEMINASRKAKRKQGEKRLDESKKERYNENVVG